MKVFWDTNVIIDYLLQREDGLSSAAEILLLGNSHEVLLQITDLTVANAAYITRKSIDRTEFFRVMKILSRCYTVVPITQSSVNSALDAEWGDFEDSMQYYAAVDAGAECIVTRNVKDFTLSEIPVYTPSEFIEML